MKRWIALSMLVFFALPISLAYGSEVGNIFTGRQGEFKLEFGVDNFQRELEIEGDIGYDDIIGTDIFSFVGMLEGGRETVNRTYLKGSYLLDPKTELYLKLGTASLRTKIDRVGVVFFYEDAIGWDMFGSYIPGTGVLSDPGTFFGFGVKRIVSQTPDLRIAADFQILMLSATDLELPLYGDAFEDDLGSYEVNALGIDSVDSLELQCAVLCKKTTGELKPYAGAKLTYFFNTYGLFYEHDDGLFGSARVTKEIEATPGDYLGFFAGVDWQLGSKSRFNLEFRVSDEVGISFGFSTTY